MQDEHVKTGAGQGGLERVSAGRGELQNNTMQIKFDDRVTVILHAIATLVDHTCRLN